MAVPVLDNVDPNWRIQPANAFTIEVLLQPDVLDVLPIWLSFYPSFLLTSELIHTVIDLDDPRVVQLLVAYQRAQGDTAIDDILRRYAMSARGSQLSLYYMGQRSAVEGTAPLENLVYLWPELAEIFHLYTQGVADASAAMFWYSQLRGRNYAGAQHALERILRRYVLSGTNISRLPRPLYTFFLNHVTGDDNQMQQLLGYAIQSTSPLYYSAWIDTFGVPTAVQLATWIPNAFRQSDFDVWALVYQPEIEDAVVSVFTGTD